MRQTKVINDKNGLLWVTFSTAAAVGVMAGDEIGVYVAIMAVVDTAAVSWAAIYEMNGED